MTQKVSYLSFHKTELLINHIFKPFVENMINSFSYGPLGSLVCKEEGGDTLLGQGFVMSKVYRSRVHDV